ncbi:MAG: cation-translocating P-type ATPase [Chloroflexi bacterium]|nr:cation-translocating P-type ATPase [Chloroflexota bacterium]MCL5104350.1 cation-translocating P-type ATPase [Armatimonadota bacterium]
MADGFDIAAARGLSEQEAASRLNEEGYNETPTARPSSVFAVALSVIREPIFLLLVGGGVVYLLLGDVQEALMLLGFVVAVIGITIYQARKTERALEALRDLSSPRALVIRDGKQRRIAGREVVRGDILVVAEGDRVAADAVLLTAANLAADESLLTGESVPVRKAARYGAAEMGRPGGDDLPFIYSGTLIVSGQGIARVRSTGMLTELGRIGVALRSVTTEDTLLQRETRRLVRNLAIVGILLSVFLVVAYGIARGHWVRGVLSGITLAMAILPEEFPVVLTVFLALGAWRISRKNVLTRRMPAIETLGAATVLCVDKTGTLTLNRMSVGRLFALGQFRDVEPPDGKHLPEAFHELVEFSILSSQRDPFDPMEKAIKELGEAYLARTEHIHFEWTLVREYPLSPELLAMSHVWRAPGGRDYVIAAKGAPEAIFDLCHLDKDERERLLARVASMADEGLRVLGIARSYFRESPLPGEQHDFEFECLGLIGLADPVRPGVREAVRECYSAGIRIAMITGDYPGTARSVAKQIGLEPIDKCITGEELSRMSDADLRQSIGDVNIFARVVPEQKLRLVQALKANGEVVAMTGDGVNDAPALKAAHIGIAMGGRGTDVARESAALVLLDDDFSSIVEAVRLGRRVFDNLKKATAYIFSIHVPIIGMSLLPIFFGWPLVLMPVHIAFLELIIDPACSVVFEAEPEEPNVMRRPPRDPREPLYGRRTIGLSLLQGAGVLLLVAGVYNTACCVVDRGMMEARALAFTSLIMANLALILANRSWSQVGVNLLRPPNPALWWVMGGAVAFLITALYVPALRTLFRFSTLHFGDILICMGVGFVSMVWFEVLKRLMLGRGRSGRPV